MPLTVEEAQANVRRTGELWTIGRCESCVCIQVSVYGNGYIVASAEQEHITAAQMRKALKRVYPDRSFITYREGGYVYARTVEEAQTFICRRERK